MVFNDKNNLDKILKSDCPVDAIRENFDEVMRIIPELRDTVGFQHKHPHHYLDVWNHTLKALSLAPKDFTIRLALLLHDIGKPHSFQDGEVRHFKGHAECSSVISRGILERLRYDDDFINEVCELIRLHDTPISDNLLAADKEFCAKLLSIQYCDAMAHHPDKLKKRLEYIKKISTKLQQNGYYNQFVKY